MRARIHFAGLVVLGLLLVTPPAPFAGTAAAAHGGNLVVGHMENLTVVDGFLGPAEYVDAFTDSATGITIHVQYSGSVMGLALDSPGRGWIAITLGAVLTGSNYTDVLSFALVNGSLVGLDLVDHGWERHLDVAIGGTDDIIAAAGTYTGSGVFIEFQVPLDSADDNDHHFLPNGTYPFSLAYNATSTDFDAPHTAHSEGLLLIIGPTPLVVTAEQPAIRTSFPSLVAGFRSTIAAVLLDPAGNPIPNQPIEFYQNTTFGLLYLGLGRTNAAGKAGIEYEPRSAGTWFFLAAFRGAGRYLPVNTSIEVTVSPPGTLPDAGLPSAVGIGFVVAAVLGGVWGSYVFVLAQLASIRRSSKRRVTRLSHTEGEGGDNHRRSK